MNEPSFETANPGLERHAWRRRFLSRMNRIRHLLRTRWWVPLAGLCLGLGGAFAWQHFRAPEYFSSGRMMMSMKLTLPEGSVYTEELSNFLGTQLALMQSGGVQNRAHARTIAQLAAPGGQPVELKVTVMPRTTIFVLQASGADPRYTQTFLDAVMEEYAALKREMRTQTSETTLAGLTEEVLRLQKELRKLDTDLADFQSSNSVVLLQEQGNSAGNYLAALNQRLAISKSEYDLIQALTLDQDLERRQSAEGADTHAGANLGGATVQPALASTETDYLKAKQQILLLKADRDEMSQFLRPKHPKMIALSDEIARRERLLDIYRQQSADQLDSRKSALALQIKSLEREAQDWDARNLEISRKTAEYERLKANSQRVQALYDRLLATMQTLDVNKEISPESVTIVEKATPALPDQPNPAKLVALGLAAGLGLAFLVLLVIDRLDDRMCSFSELQDLFDEETLGQIPREKAPKGASGPLLLQPQDQRHGFAEANRNLRSSILFAGADPGARKTLLITSSVPGEGKSMTAANLALTLASSESRVLLIDADLRKGLLHERLGLKMERGLSEVLAGRVPWREAITATSTPNLTLLPRGSVTHRSSELFLAPAAGKLLRQLAAEYDFVVLDTPPVMAADDAATLAPLADSTIFVVRAEYTSARVARAALELLYQRRVKVLGLVFNAVRPSAADYYYYKYHDYYASYPEAAGG